VAALAQSRVTDRVDASVEAMQTAGKDAKVQCAGWEAEGSELVQGYDAMLTSSERGGPPVRWAEFPAYTR
jgi:hypothetical protein